MERSFDWLWDKYKEGARDKFEEVCYKIYKNEHPDAEVKRVRVQHGDGGIDVYIDYPDKFIVVQCKFFINGVSPDLCGFTTLRRDKVPKHRFGSVFYKLYSLQN